MQSWKLSVFLHTRYELPLQILANLLPDEIVGDQAIATLEQWKKDFVLVQLEEFKELVEDVGITQEVGAVVGTVE